MRLFTYVSLLLIAFISTEVSAQQTLKQSSKNASIVRKFLNGFNDPSKIQESLDLLADDYQFENPMIKLHSKSEFIELAKAIGAVLTGVEIINIAENNDWVSVRYIFKSSVANLESSIATEWFRLENGLIKESQLIYDASEWRNFYAQMEK